MPAPLSGTVLRISPQSSCVVANLVFAAKPQEPLDDTKRHLFTITTNDWPLIVQLNNSKRALLIQLQLVAELDVGTHGVFLRVGNCRKEQSTSVVTPKNWTQIVTTLGDPDLCCLFGKPLGLELSRRQISQ